MNVLTSIAIALGTSVTAGLAILKAVGHLKNSEAVRELVLEWLTKPGGPQSTFQAQYLQVQRRLFGDSIFSRQRSLAIATIFILIFLIELPLGWLYSDPGKHPDLPIWLTFLGIFAFFHWSFVTGHIFVATLLTVVAFLLTHVSFWIFDTITLRTIAFGNRLYVYILLIIASFVAVYWLSTLFAGLLLWYFTQETAGQLFSVLLSAPITIPREAMSLWTSAMEAEDVAGAIPFFFLLVVGGGTILCASAMCVASMFNLVYAAALTVMRIDQFFRNKYRWKQDELFKNPIEYLSYVSAALAFMVAFPVVLTVALLK